ncbi:amidohydrolase family protein [Aliifodinibius sp. S!AR15-10]|uniref:amidohydrolase family protein n=1 Tax=Aliifodinibius sp. S!AR15-10 TaxID=2950437 RepID=UPI00286247B2|nr:amidohydrolase family protein [Aliifodinibius sp. S!AR15-10]MDR8394310.1 amidohydrolase family protein [Aliifodinibius sp. S!AR15-10]
MKCRIIPLVVIFVTILGTSSLEAQDQKVIDTQLHALELDIVPAHWDTLMGYKRPTSAEALRNQTIEQLERFNITTAITSGDEERLTQFKEAAPDRIIRSQWIPWDIKGDSLRAYIDSLPTWYEQGRFQVIGEVLTQYSGIAPSDPILDPLWSFAERESVPVGIHINDLPVTCPESFTDGCSPLAMKEVLEQYPNLKVYIMHAGYPHMQDMIELMESHPQVYVGITMPPKELHRYLKGLIDAGFGDRIMFGSDQMLWPELIELFVNAIESADFLSEEQKNAIFYDNAAGFFEFDY